MKLGANNGSYKMASDYRMDREVKLADDDLGDLYSRYLLFADKMAVDHSALEIAAVMMAQAMSMYKTVLDSTDYNRMVDSIGHMRNDVKSFNTQPGNCH